LGRDGTGLETDLFFAPDLDSKWSHDIPDVSGRQLPVRTRGLVGNTSAVQKRSSYFSLECKVHILRNVSRELRDVHGVQFCCNDTY
jgi:hypothetical protein